MEIGKILQEPHYGKPKNILFEGFKYHRMPVQTKSIIKGDGISSIIFETLKDNVSDGDCILLAESALAADQGRTIQIDKINPGFWARNLTKFMTKTKAGIGASDPLTMQIAIEEVGILRILLGAFIAAITKPFGIKGMFYHVTGDKVRCIDGPADYVIPPYNKHVVMLPENPGEFCKTLEEKFHKYNKKKVLISIIDANDIGINVLEPLSKNHDALAKALASDNPLGQSDESTPILFAKKIN